MISRVGLVFGALILLSLSAACGSPRPAASEPEARPSLEPSSSASAAAPAAPAAPSAPIAKPERVDPWAGRPPLSPEGHALYQARYDVTTPDGGAWGAERVAVGEGASGLVIVGQSRSTSGPAFEDSYRWQPGLVTESIQDPSGGRELTGTVDKGVLKVTGTEGGGRPVLLTAAVPEGGFLSPTGVSAMLVLVSKLGDMKVGERRQLSALMLSVRQQSAAINLVEHDVERRADQEGLRVFQVKSEAGRFRQSAEVHVEPSGSIVKQVLSGSVNATYTREP